MTAIKDGQGKSFLFQNWKTCFEILDGDGTLIVHRLQLNNHNIGSGKVSLKEFQTLGFLFNFSTSAIRKIYAEFHTAGTTELDTSDFQLFVLAAVEIQGKIDKLRQEEGGGMYAWKKKLANLYW